MKAANNMNTANHPNAIQTPQTPRTNHTLLPSSPSPNATHPIDLIHAELAAELIALLNLGGNPAGAVDQPLTPGGYPAFFRRHTDKLPAAIDKYMRREKNFDAISHPGYRLSPPRECFRSIHLDEISNEDQDQIAIWLSQSMYEQVLDRLPYPPPIGLSIKTSESSLRRLWNRRETQRRIRISSDEAKFLNVTAASPDEFSSATQQLLRVRTLEAAMNPESKTSELRDLFNILDRIRAADLAERRVSLAEKKQTEPKHDPSQNNK